MRPAKKATRLYLERVALWYLERHAGCEAQLRRVLRKRVWRSFAEHAEPTREEGEQAIEEVVGKLRGLGYIDDERFASSRAKTLRRQGKSTRAIRSKLRQLGVDSAAIDQASEGDDLEAARTYVRKRRLVGGKKDLAKLARAGFSYDVAKRALEAE